VIDPKEASREGYFRVIGTWETKLYGPDGKLKDVQSGHNVVTTSGKDALAVFLASAAAAATTFTTKYIAIGTGSTAETASDTTLNTESIRTTGTVSYITSQIYQVTATFATGSGTGAITEYGVFNSNSAGTMYARYTKSVINKGANDTLTVVCQLTLS
jgi:Zn-dependent M28 family amino/carboxypeptidase